MTLSKKLSIDELLRLKGVTLSDDEREALIEYNDIEAGGYILWFDKDPDERYPMDLYDLYITVGDPDPNEPETIDLKIKVIY